jgi:hypothetical protein
LQGLRHVSRSDEDQLHEHFEQSFKVTGLTIGWWCKLGEAISDQGSTGFVE